MKSRNRSLSESNSLPPITLLRRSCLAADRDFTLIYAADSLPKSTPWDLKALSHPPKWEWADTVTAGVRSLYYQAESYQGKITRVFAYYATPGSLAGDPSKDKNLPAVVLVHGGGGQAFQEWVELWAKRGYAAIAMDLAGNGPNATRLEDGGPNQSDEMKFDRIGQHINEQWSYHAVADVILAHSLVRSFSEVNPDQTAVIGISWGGYLVCIVSGLDNRFTASVSVYGCGFLADNSCWLCQFEKMSPENKAKWLQLWDPSTYVGSATMPMLFVNGGMDPHYPPDSHAKTYALVQSPKNLCFTSQFPHDHIFDRPKTIEVFIEQNLRGGTPLPRIATPTVGEKQIMADVDTKTKLVSAQICYTTDRLPGDYETRRWVEKPMTIQGNRIIADRGPEDAAIWFMTVTDQRGVTVSGELAFSR